MTAPKPIIKGVSTVFKETRQISYNSGGKSETVTLVGKWTDLLTEIDKYPPGTYYGNPVNVVETVNKTVNGQSVSVQVTKRTRLAVTSSTLVQDGAGMGRLTLVCSTLSETEEEGSSSISAPIREKWTVSMQMQNMQLAEHPSFPSGNATEWALFLASPASVQAQNQYCTNPDDATTATQLPSGLYDWAALYCTGIQSYMCYLPVVTKVSVYGYFPGSVAGGIGKKSTPGQYSGLATDWLKTADDLEEDESTGKWRRTEQWTGAHEWPNLLYG